MSVYAGLMESRLLVRALPWGVVGVLIAVVLYSGLTYGEGSGDRFGGDFPSFYGAGSIVLDGDGNELYDADRQLAAQEPFLEDGEFLYFAYPPFVGAAYAPLAALPYGVAYSLHAAVAILAVIGGVIALRPLARGHLDGPVNLGLATCAALLSYPLLRSVLGGQNTSFTLLGLALLARFTHDDRDVASGIVLAALMYKPQYGLLAALVLIVARRWRVVALSVFAALPLFVVGALTTGWDWIATWIDAATSFGEQNLIVNGKFMISAWGWVANLVGSTTGATIAASIVVCAVGLPILWAIATDRWTGLPWYAVLPALLVAAPSALYYDAGILVITIVGLISIAGSAVWFTTGVVVISWVGLAAAPAGWEPLFIPIAATAVAFAIAAIRAPELS